LHLYKKLTLINTGLGLFISILILVTYIFINSFIGIPILGLFLGGTIVHVIILIAINFSALFVILYFKNTRMIGLILIICGVIVFGTITFLGIPSLVLFVISGILALRQKRLHA